MSTKDEIAKCLIASSDLLTTHQIAENIGLNYKTVFNNLTEMVAIGDIEKIEKTYQITDAGRIAYAIEKPKPQRKPVKDIVESIVQGIEKACNSLPETDNVNSPPHYTNGKIECIDAIDAGTVNKTGIEAVCVANIIKYLWRYESKNGVEDVKKAQWYLNKLIEVLE